MLSPCADKRNRALAVALCGSLALDNRGARVSSGFHVLFVSLAVIHLIFI